MCCGIPDTIESARHKYSTASVKNEELPSSWIKDQARRRKSEETVLFRIVLALTSNSNRGKFLSIKCHILSAQCQITRSVLRGFPTLLSRPGQNTAPPLSRMKSCQAPGLMTRPAGGNRRRRFRSESPGHHLEFKPKEITLHKMSRFVGTMPN